MYSFQAWVKLNKKAMASAGVDKGKTTLKKAPNSEQPSTRAASSKLFGMESKYPFNTQIEKGSEVTE